jgi:hypothetical protein
LSSWFVDGGVGLSWSGDDRVERWWLGVGGLRGGLPAVAWGLEVKHININIYIYILALSLKNLGSLSVRFGTFASLFDAVDVKCHSIAINTFFGRKADLNPRGPTRVPLRPSTYACASEATTKPPLPPVHHPGEDGRA